jgi:two-component system sensor histidine kinase ChiS
MLKLREYNITVLEKEGPIIEELMDTFRREGYLVKAINDNYSNTEILKECMKTDIVVIGNLLRKEYNFSIIDRIRETFPQAQIPILFICESNSIKDIPKAFGLGINDCIIKPFNIQELLARINNLAKIKSEAEDDNLSKAFLQAQIKPHFIFNVLNTASHLCTDKPEKAKDVLLDFSDYFRASFIFKECKGITNLERELELLRAYISMEQARFKDKLKIELFVDDEADCMLPMFSIKALAENSIKHGVLRKDLGGKVEISIEVVKNDNLIKVTVSDDGVGISEEKGKEILSDGIMSKNKSLKYIDMKLKALYGNGLIIKSKKDEGTVVEFFIPLNRGDMK